MSKKLADKPRNAGALRKRCKWCDRIIEIVRFQNVVEASLLSHYGRDFGDRYWVLNPNGSQHKCDF